MQEQIPRKQNCELASQYSTLRLAMSKDGRARGHQVKCKLTKKSNSSVVGSPGRFKRNNPNEPLHVRVVYLVPVLF
jgi:hypothetical protein